MNEEEDAGEGEGKEGKMKRSRISRKEKEKERNGDRLETEIGQVGNSKREKSILLQVIPIVLKRTTQKINNDKSINKPY